MPCSDAMVKDTITIKPSTTVQQALEMFKEHDVRNFPVVDDNGKLLGIFGLRNILLKLLPVSVTMEDGLQNLDFVMGSSPGIAKRLRKLYPTAVEDSIEKNNRILDAETSTWEVVRVMALHGSPVALVNEANGDYVGMISHQSLLSDMRRLMEEADAETKTDET